VKWGIHLSDVSAMPGRIWWVPARLAGEGASDPSTPVIRIAWVFACAFACLSRGVIERDPFQLGKGTWNLRKQTQFPSPGASSAVARAENDETNPMWSQVIVKKGLVIIQPSVIFKNLQQSSAMCRNLQESSGIFRNLQESSRIFSSPGSPHRLCKTNPPPQKRLEVFVDPVDASFPLRSIRSVSRNPILGGLISGPWTSFPSAAR
jgi:hypothetical protein